MIFTQIGTYNITYTAEDACGNKTTVTREVIVSGGALQDENEVDLATENDEVIEAS